jgi:hypothetical protein
MPLYEVTCKKCKKSQDIFRKLADYNNLPMCCDTIMTRVISPTFVHAEFPTYKSMIDGSMISDRGQHRRHLRANGCSEVGNDKIEQKHDYVAEKRKKEQLRSEISARLN